MNLIAGVFCLIVLGLIAFTAIGDARAREDARKEHAAQRAAASEAAQKAVEDEKRVEETVAQHFTDKRLSYLVPAGERDLYGEVVTEDDYQYEVDAWRDQVACIREGDTNAFQCIHTSQERDYSDGGDEVWHDRTTHDVDVVIDAASGEIQFTTSD